LHTYVSVVRTGRKITAVACVEYLPEQSTCLAAAEAFLSEKTGVERHKIWVRYLGDIKDNKNFIMPCGIPTWRVG
jgi:hypothetical protein